MRFVASRNVHRVAIGIGEYGYTLNAHAPCCTRNANSDFSPVGNKNFGEHGLAFHPNGFALVEERANALFGFSCRANLRDTLDGVFHQFVID